MYGFCTAECNLNFPTNVDDLDPVSPSPDPDSKNQQNLDNLSVAVVNMVLVALWCYELSYVP